MKHISLFSLFSYFAAVKPCALTYGSKAEGQPTRCGHTLARCPLPGLASACRPSNPANSTKSGFLPADEEGKQGMRECAPLAHDRNALCSLTLYADKRMLLERSKP